MDHVHISAGYVSGLGSTSIQYLEGYVDEPEEHDGESDERRVPCPQMSLRTQLVDTLLTLRRIVLVANEALPSRDAAGAGLGVLYKAIHRPGWSI